MCYWAWHRGNRRLGEAPQGATPASSQSISFFEATGWFLTDFRPMGLVDLGVAYNVWAANANEQYVLLNGEAPVFFPKDSKELKIDSDLAYPKFLAAFTPTPNFPANQERVVAWPSDNVFETESALPRNGQRFIFQFSVNNGCHACGTGYFARFAFDVGSAGQVLNTSLLGICRGPHAQIEIADIENCHLPNP
jgi:hypothetical protein